MFQHEAESMGCGTSQMLKCNMFHGITGLVCGSCMWLFWPVLYSPITSQSLLYYAYSCDYYGVDHPYL